jgi:hypothetical protein
MKKTIENHINDDLLAIQQKRPANDIWAIMKFTNSWWHLIHHPSI